jgi:hypothetical protein
VGVLSSIPIPHRMTTATPSPLSTAQPTFGELFVHKLERSGTHTYFAGARPTVRRMLETAGFNGGAIHYAADVADALEQIKTSPRTSA